MKSVKAGFEAELPFWLCIDNNIYDILIDGKLWKIELSNDKWLIAMGNELDNQIPFIAIAPKDIAQKYNEIKPGQPYYHKRKLKTVLQMGFAWNVGDNAKAEDAKKTLNSHIKWCTETFIKATNRFIEIYRTSGTIDKIPLTLGYYDLSSNWWYTLFLDDEVIERVRLGLDIYPVIMKPPFETNKNIQTEIASKLKSNYSPSSWVLILENAIGLHRRENYRMAVIEMYTGFEVFMIEFLRKKYAEKEYDEGLIEYLMNRSELNHMLNQGLKLAIGKSFSDIDNTLWSLWDDKKKGVRKLRHDIIHKGMLLVSQKNSENTLGTIEKMIKILNTKYG